MAFQRELLKFRNLVALQCKRLVQNEILVLGDSHTRVFQQKRIQKCIPGSFFHIVGVKGATASGLTNPNSKTQSYQIFRKALEKTRAKQVVVMLGEVDTGFVIWYRIKKYDQPVADMLQTTVKTYTEFLRGLKESGMHVICISAPLPTIEDWNDNRFQRASKANEQTVITASQQADELDEIASARQQVSASLAERTALTLAFNQQVEEICRHHDICFLNFDSESLGNEGTVAPKLLSSNSRDHHYDEHAYASMIALPLEQAIRSARAV